MHDKNAESPEPTGQAVRARRPRIFLAEDHVLIIRRVTDLLRADFDVVGSAENGSDLIAEAQRLLPDLIVLDISMPGMPGIEAAHQLRARGSKARFVFLTTYDRTEFVRACMAAGALGYVLKSRMGVDLIPAIRAALVGRHFISPSLSDGMEKPCGPS